MSREMRRVLQRERIAIYFKGIRRVSWEMHHLRANDKFLNLRKDREINFIKYLIIRPAMKISSEGTQKIVDSSL